MLEEPFGSPTINYYYHLWSPTRFEILLIKPNSQKQIAESDRTSTDGNGERPFELYTLREGNLTMASVFG